MSCIEPVLQLDNEISDVVWYAEADMIWVLPADETLLRLDWTVSPNFIVNFTPFYQGLIYMMLSEVVVGGLGLASKLVGTRDTERFGDVTMPCD